jgi:multidrug efflux pump subunit AcrB
VKNLDVRVLAVLRELQRTSNVSHAAQNLGLTCAGRKRPSSLQSVPGVAEVATIGGFVKQYQVNVDPHRLLAYKVPLMQVMDAVRNGNNEVGARSPARIGSVQAFAV